MKNKEFGSALKRGQPFAGLPGVEMANFELDVDGFDARFKLRSTGNSVTVYVEFKSRCTPLSIEQVAPWITRVKALKPGVAVALMCEFLPSTAQEYCKENQIDFIDLTGNVFINVPGKFYLERTGKGTAGTSRTSTPIANPFSGRSSRVVRVLLQKQQAWRLKDIALELEEESRRNFLVRASEDAIRFSIDRGSISRAVSTLEDLLLIRRRGSEILVPEPRMLLQRWAERYAERYRWRLRSAFTTTNPFGGDVRTFARGFDTLGLPYAITSVAAASVRAPFVEAESFEVYLLKRQDFIRARPQIENRAGYSTSFPRLRVIAPYDIGIFMYASRDDGVPAVSPVQMFLDLYARGGRDRKQADYLLDQVIQKLWRS